MTHNPNPPPSEQGDKPVVTQADRDLVYSLMLPAAKTALERKALEYIRDGRGDDAEAVIAVARHREQETREVALLVNQSWLDRRQAEPDAETDAGAPIRQHVMPGDPAHLMQTTLQWYLKFDFGYPHSVRESNIAAEAFKDGFRAALSAPPAPEQADQADAVGELVEALEIAIEDHDNRNGRFSSPDHWTNRARTALAKYRTGDA